MQYGYEKVCLWEKIHFKHSGCFRWWLYCHVTRFSSIWTENVITIDASVLSVPIGQRWRDHCIFEPLNFSENSQDWKSWISISIVNCGAIHFLDSIKLIVTWFDRWQYIFSSGLSSLVFYISNILVIFFLFCKCKI